METAWRPKTMHCPHCGHHAEIVSDAVSESSNMAAMGTYRLHKHTSPDQPRVCSINSLRYSPIARLPAKV